MYLLIFFVLTTSLRYASVGYRSTFLSGLTTSTASTTYGSAEYCEKAQTNVSSTTIAWKCITLNQ